MEYAAGEVRCVTPPGFCNSPTLQLSLSPKWVNRVTTSTGVLVSSQ